MSLKALWRGVRRPIARSVLVKGALASTMTASLRVIRWTNPLLTGSDDPLPVFDSSAPLIVAMWHGQHLTAPVYWPRGIRLHAMVSRSADAELNAMVLKRFGIEVSRGSGGRENINHLEKGGARALIALKKTLDAGVNVFMIADIPHGTPREAGLGIVTLARLSGRPILPAAIATSRRKVFEKSWDRTTLSLPFGRSAIALGPLVEVGRDADAAELERKRSEVTTLLNEATDKAYRMVDERR